MYPAFYIQPIKIYYRLSEPWERPYFLGSRLRGMFGHALSALCCNQTIKSSSCHHFSTCAYHQVFIAKTHNKKQLATPYVIQTSELGAKTLDKGEVISFTVLLFNQAINFLPKILQAWATAHFEENTSSIEFVKAELVNSQNLVQATWHKEDDFPLVNPFTPTQRVISSDLYLNVLTPLQLRQRGQVIRIKDLKAEHIVFAALRRLKNLTPNWEELYPDLTLPPEIVAAWAKSVEISSTLNWIKLKRWSNNQHQEIPLSGMVGQINLRGNLEPFMSALNILPYTGLGKNCNLGLGQIKIIH